MSEILPRTFGKCCFRYDLLIGCAIYVTIEVYLWAMLALASTYSEFKMIENRDLDAFQNFTLNSTYYVTTFGNPSDDIGLTVICMSKRVVLVSVENFMNENFTICEEKKNRFIFLFTVTHIVINGIFSISLIVYCIFSVILLIGISEVREFFNK